MNHLITFLTQHLASVLLYLEKKHYACPLSVSYGIVAQWLGAIMVILADNDPTLQGCSIKLSPQYSQLD